jgi:SNF2 family DNA or RNA helicase
MANTLKLFKHQQDALEWGSSRDWAAYFMETGTGKTAVALELFKLWQVIRDAKKVVVVCLNTLTGNWVKEAKLWGVPRAVACVGDKTKRIKLINSDSWDVLTINYESLRSPEILAALIAAQPRGLCFDEIHRCKDRTAQQTKGAKQLSKAVKALGGARIGLTGTPVVQSPLDLWSIFDVLDPGETPKTHPLGFGNYYGFEQGVCNKKPHPRLGHRVPIYEYPDHKLEELKRRVAPLAFEATKDECLDLPGQTFVPPILLEMGDEQAKVYKALRDDYICFLDGTPPPSKAVDKLKALGLTTISQNQKALDEFNKVQGDYGVGLDRQISVTFATTLQTRLQQIAAGFIKTDDGELRELPNIKATWLEEHLPMLSNPIGDHKCVIMCRFTYDIAFLMTLLDKMKLGYVTLSGANSSHAADVVEKFQTNPGTRVFVGNMAVASTGITLTAADSMVYYTCSFSGEQRRQSIDRIYRIGQKRKVTYYDLVACLDGKPTVDGRVLLNHSEKESLAIKTVANLKEAIL